jgi:hypothetical protein
MTHRLDVTLSDEQYEHLRRESERSGLPMAELVRRAVDRTYRAGLAADVQRALKSSLGGWTDRDFDGASYVEGLRRGMAHRLR